MLAVSGSFPCGGEEVKHSSGDNKDCRGNEGPFPNLNGGRRFSARPFFEGTDVVECTLVRDNEGRCRVSRLRLVKILDFVDDLARMLTQTEQTVSRLLSKGAGRLLEEMR